MPRGARRALVVIGMGLACVGMLLLVLQLAFSRWLPIDDIIESWSADLGIALRVDSAHARLFPRPALELEGVAIDPGFEIARVEVLLNIRNLVRGRFVGTRVRVRGPIFTLMRRPDGSLGLDASAASSDGGAGAPATLPSGLSLLPRVEARGGTIRYVDYTAAEAPRVTELYVDRADLRTDLEGDVLDARLSGSLEPGGTSDAIHIALHVEGTSPVGTPRVQVRITTDGIEAAQVVPHLPPKWGVRDATGAVFSRIALTWGEEAGLTGDLDLRLSPGTLDYAGIRARDEVSFQAGLRDDGVFRIERAHMTAAAATLGRVEASALESRFDYAQRTATFESISFEAWGGSVQAEGTVGIRDPLEFDLEVSVENLALPKMRGGSAEAVPPDATRLDGNASLHGHWRGGEDWLYPIAGIGNVSLRGGRVVAGDVIKTLVRLLPTHAQKRDGEDHGPAWDTTPLEELTSSFRLEGGRANSRDLRMITADYAIEAQGWFDPTTDYAFNGALDFTSDGFAKLRHLTHLDDKVALPPVPFQVKGNLADRTFALEMDEEPLAAVIVVPWAVHQAVDTTSDAIGGGAHAAEGAVGAGADAAKSIVDWVDDHVGDEREGDD